MLGLSDEDAHMQWQALVFPQFSPSITPDWVITWALWPEGPQRTKVIFELYSRKRSTPVDYSDLIKWTDFVIRQDIEICQIQQAGLNSEIFDGCRFGSLEEAVQHFQKLYANAIGQ